MKKTNHYSFKYLGIALIVVLFLIKNSISYGQLCDPPPYINGGSTFVVVPGTFTTYSKIEDGVSRDYYALKCKTNPMLFYVSRFPPIQTETRYYVELYAQNFDCSGNLLGTPNLILTRPTKVSTNGFPMWDNFFINVEENTSYTVKMYVDYPPYTPSWYLLPQFNNIRFVKSAEQPTPDGFFGDHVNYVSRTSTGTGWTIDVSQLDINGLSIFNATPSSCEQNWRYEISEFDLDSWTSSNLVASPVISGEAGYIDMETFYTYGLERDKLYLLKLIVGEGWYDEYFWFEIKPAKIDGSLSNNGIITESVDVGGGVFIDYTLHERCQDNPMYYNKESTVSIDQHEFIVQPVDASYLPSGASMSSGTHIGAPIVNTNLGFIYGPFTLWQRYKVTFIVTTPGWSKVMYFRYRTCGPDDDGTGMVTTISQLNSDGQLENRGTSVLNIKKEFADQIKIYPNPTKQKVFVDLNSLEGSELITIQLLDVFGKTLSLSEFFSKTDEFVLDMAERPNGLYFIKVLQGDKILIRKIIKN
ncbi:MAG: hypothetical protein COA38_13350 [Fluviicola sp.]|nr:MAG: hypothetical protein COA38_13350 [Fluviicola sp.]